ncbi:MAG: DUF6072 family protein [Sphingomonas oligoaromativorans]|jgi:hypothetical protein
MSNALADNNSVIGRTAMVAGEVLLPGASSLIRGEIGTGVGTFVAAGLAAAVLAPSMPLMATLAAIGLRANSYKVATTGTNLLTSVADILPQKPVTTAKAA